MMMNKLALAGAIALVLCGPVNAAEKLSPYNGYTPLTPVHKFEFTYGIKSWDTNNKTLMEKYRNSRNNYIRFEYRLDNNGYAISSFKNAFQKQYVLLDYARYWKPYSTVELSVNLGVKKGWDYSSGKDKTVPFWSLGIAHTATHDFVPKLSFSSGVITLSFSKRF